MRGGGGAAGGSGVDPAAARARVRRRLLRWYDGRRRPLPWRETRDPYAIWVSEVMLQQTRVETVLRYWPRFLRRFPTVGALARAREDSVLAAWSGLGYYSRARSLHRAAKIVVDRHGGRIPSDVETLRTLPGVGRYTAGAVASIGFGKPAAVVDGNVARVLARLFAVPGDGRTPRVSKQLWSIAKSLVPLRRPGDWNQALMELGATVCVPRAPACETCPLRGSCVAYRRSAVHRYPGSAPRRPAVPERQAVAVVEHAGRVLLVRREAGRQLRRLFEFPGVVVPRRTDPRTALGAALSVLGLECDLPERPWGAVRHSILDRRIETLVYRTRARRAPAGPGRWVERGSLARLPLSAAGLHIRDALRGGATLAEACPVPVGPDALRGRLTSSPFRRFRSAHASRKTGARGGTA